MGRKKLLLLTFPEGTKIGEVKRGSEIISTCPKRYKYIWRPCADCNKPTWFNVRSGGSRCHSCCSRKAKWKGGRFVNSQGYVHIFVPPTDFFASMRQAGGYVMEHRLVMARHLGRCLQPWELVHHKGIRYKGIKNKLDNLMDNLQLITDTRHNQITILEKRIATLEKRVTLLEAENTQLKLHIQEIEESVPL